MKPFHLNLTLRPRFWVLLGLYGLALVPSLWLAYELRFDFIVDAKAQQERLFVLCWLIPLQLVFLGLFHQLNTLLDYFSIPDLTRMVHALSIASGIALGVRLAWGAGAAPSMGIILLDLVFCIVELTAARLALRNFRESIAGSSRKDLHGHQNRRRVAIIGAGDAGAVLAHELYLKSGYGLDPVAFFDDDASKWASRVHDIPVLGPPEKLIGCRDYYGIVEAIIAMPSASPRRITEIVNLVHQAGVGCKTVPGLDQLALGQVRISQLRHIEVQDLLGRERVELDTENIRQVLSDRVVLVTGAGGSIGSEICRQIAPYHPKLLLLLDRSEPAIFQLEQELQRSGHGERIRPLVGDILDLHRMRAIFSKYQPEVLFHAAAHKHVPMMELQPCEAIQNNSIGTAQLADLALEYGVDRFTLISSDKAINPTSVMGAAKRLAESYIQSLQAANPGRTKFLAVRFGNVLGSSGSVIPLFQRQIAEGGPVTVTHPEMTRYFMTIPEASMLVLQSATQGLGGEIFVLDMGNPIRIADLARQMIELSGLRAGEDIQIKFIGIRPGEKLFEEISHAGENFAPTNHPKICRFLSEPAGIAQVREALRGLREKLYSLEPDEMKLAIKQVVPDYQPCLGIRQDNQAGRAG